MIATFTAFDVRNLFSQGGRVALPLVFVVLITVALPLPAIALYVAAITTIVSVSTPFLGDERGRLDTLYATLPLRRETVVAGRYVTLVALYLVTVVIVTVTLVVAAAVTGRELDAAQLVLAAAVAFLVVALALSVQLPVFFSVGFTRARPMMYIPLAIMVAATWVAPRLGIADEDVLAHVSTFGPGAIVAASVGLGVLLLTLSAVVSCRCYVRRDI